jgi:secreted trypsin-like serine protease
MSFSLLVGCEHSIQKESLDNEVLSSTITHSKISKDSKLPWIVKVDLCGGVIISSRHILTVAHCVKESVPHFINIRAGGDGLIRDLTRLPKVKSIHIHPEYKNWVKKIKKNDIAILELEEDIVFTEKIKLVNLPSESDVPARYSPNELILGGWGRIENKKYPKELHYFNNIKIADAPSSSFWDDENSQALLKSDDVNQDFKQTFETGQYLAIHVESNISACRGDSGSPLVDLSQNLLFALVSHGNNNCEDQPLFFMIKVKLYLNWIDSIINNKGSHD